MAEEVGIVMSLYDKVSPTLKAIAGNSKAFDKDLDDLEQSLKAYEKAQDDLVGRSADLKKALAESDQKVRDAQKSYRKLKDETSKGTLDAAIDEQTRLKSQLTETEGAIKANETAYKALYKTATDTATALSKAENRAGSLIDGEPGGETGILSDLGQAGLISMAGDAAGTWANALVGSAFGSTAGSLFSGGLGGAVQGAALGSLLGPAGAVVGAAIGGGIGLLTSGAQVYQERDEAFKSYVQEATQGQLEEMSAAISAGSDTAAQRELDLIAFNQLLGGKGEQYLADLREMAAATPMEYEDLTAMSRALATGFGTDQQRMLELMEGIGNAGSAVGTDASSMTYMAQVLSRMQSSGKASLEDLNAFQDRGIDVIGMLSKALGKSQGDIYEMISDGAISGTRAVDIIQQGLEQYAGAMDKMSRTYSGLTSTLADAQTEMDNAYGEGYNEERKKGLQAEIDYLGGYSGELMQQANRAMGAWQAELENSKEQYQREALSAVMSGAATTLFDEEAQAALNEKWADYQLAQSKGDAAEMGRILAETKVFAQGEYIASDGAQLMIQYEIDLAEAIRDDAASNDAYWDAGYRKGQEYSKGWAAALRDNVTDSGMLDTWVDEGGNVHTTKPRTDGWYDDGGNFHPNAFGLDRVPYDNYPALLHQGERVLTAREAREADSRPGRSLSITITGNQFGAGVSAEEIAQRLADQIELKFAAGVLS